MHFPGRSTARRAAGVVLFTGSLALLSACSGGGGSGPSLELKEYSFTPNTVTLTAGQPVTLTLKNTGTLQHDFAIPDLNVTSPVVNPGQTTTYTFTPSRAGTFQFICNQPGHKEAGMVGTATIQ